MNSKRRHTFAVTATIVACVAQPVVAAPEEPLVVTQLPDPDPNYAPLPPEKRSARPPHGSDENPTLNEAFENLGRSAGQLAQIAEQRARARADEMTRDAQQQVRRTMDQVCTDPSKLPEPWRSKCNR